MQKIVQLTNKKYRELGGVNLSTFAQKSIKELSSLSHFMKDLKDYGPLLTAKEIIEPFSSGESSPCFSDKHLENDGNPETFRKKCVSFHEVGKIFLDSLATVEITDATQDSIWYSSIMICGLYEEKLTLKFMALLQKHLDPNLKGTRTVIYKGEEGLMLELIDHITAQKTFKFLKEDFYALNFIKKTWKVLRIYNRMNESKYASQFFAIVLKNLPSDSTVETISILIENTCDSISYLNIEIPTLIGNSCCSVIRTNSLSDAELLALKLNGIETEGVVM